MSAFGLLNADTKVVIIMGVLFLVVIVLGVAISAEEYITEKIYSSDSKGKTDGQT